jgi:hypothetical protein
MVPCEERHGQAVTRLEAATLRRRAFENQRHRASTRHQTTRRHLCHPCPAPQNAEARGWMRADCLRPLPVKDVSSTVPMTLRSRDLSGLALPPAHPPSECVRHPLVHLLNIGCETLD